MLSIIRAIEFHISIKTISMYYRY